MDRNEMTEKVNLMVWKHVNFDVGKGDISTQAVILKFYSIVQVSDKSIKLNLNNIIVYLI